MGSQVQCTLLERTDLARRSLRRFVYSSKGECPAGGCHHASVVIDAAVLFESEWNGKGDDSWPHDDARWPVVCEACGYTFHPDDQWQHNLDRLWRAPDGTLYTHHEAPVGSMCFGCSTGPSSAEAIARGLAPNSDGISSEHLSVKLPDGVWWDIDAPSSRNYQVGGSGWTREGDAPRVTAHPSIQTGAYHGWLTNGVLSEC